MNVSFALLETNSLAESLQETLVGEELFSITDSLHHRMYHYAEGETIGTIYIPLSLEKAEEELFWSFASYTDLEQTPEWFQSRFRIVKAIWDKIAHTEKEHPKTVTQYKTHSVRNQMIQIFDQYDAPIPQLVFWKKEHANDVYYAVHSVDVAVYQPQKINGDILQKIKSIFKFSDYEDVKKEGQLYVAL